MYEIDKYDQPDMKEEKRKKKKNKKKNKYFMCQNSFKGLDKLYQTKSAIDTKLILPASLTPCCCGITFG